MFITTLGRLNELDISLEIDSDYKFKDVDSEAYYAPYIYWGKDKKIINGVGNDMFSPDASITREDAMVMIYNYLDGENSDNIAHPEIEDMKDFSEYSLNAITWGYSKGIIKGYDNKFFPKETLTRAETSQIIMNISEYEKDSKVTGSKVLNFNVSDIEKVEFRKGYLESIGKEPYITEDREEIREAYKIFDGLEVIDRKYEGNSIGENSYFVVVYTLKDGQEVSIVFNPDENFEEDRELYIKTADGHVLELNESINVDKILKFRDLLK